MSKLRSSISKVVNEISDIPITGNIIPNSWWAHIRRGSTNKPYDQAIIILADIIYWYRKQEIRDEVTGHTIGFKQKFAADKLQRSYESYAKQFGYSKKQVRCAIAHLVSNKILTIEFRTVNTGTMILNNVLYVEPNPQKIREITTPLALQDKRVPYKKVIGSCPSGITMPHLLRVRDLLQSMGIQELSCLDSIFDHALLKQKQIFASQIEELSDLIEDTGIPNYPVVLCHLQNLYGCVYLDGDIPWSLMFLDCNRANTLELLRIVYIHEAAHLMSGGHDHDLAFALVYNTFRFKAGFAVSDAEYDYRDCDLDDLSISDVKSFSTQFANIAVEARLSDTMIASCAGHISNCPDLILQSPVELQKLIAAFRI